MQNKTQRPSENIRVPNELVAEVRLVCEVFRQSENLKKAKANLAKLSQKILSGSISN